MWGDVGKFEKEETDGEGSNAGRSGIMHYVSAKITREQALEILLGLSRRKVRMRGDGRNEGAGAQGSEIETADASRCDT